MTATWSSNNYKSPFKLVDLTNSKGNTSVKLTGEYSLACQNSNKRWKNKLIRQCTASICQMLSVSEEYGQTHTLVYIV